MKLSLEDKLEIVRLYEEQGLSHREIAIGMGCNFGLCSQPSKYYNRYTHTMNKDSFYPDGTSTSYAKELMYIDGRVLKWYSDIPIVYANR